MSAGGSEQARAVARELLAACLPGTGRPAAPVTESFRCWTPLRDWEPGSQGIATLRQIMAAYCGALPDGVPFRPNAIIADESVVVVEAATPGTSQDAVSVTLVLALSSALVDEARCYIDPRAMGAAAEQQEAFRGI